MLHGTTTDATDNQQPMTVSEAARALNKSAQTIRVWADRGKLPVVRTATGQRIFLRGVIERMRGGR